MTNARAAAKVSTAHKQSDGTAAAPRKARTATELTVMPSPKEIEVLKAQDIGYTEAAADAMTFLESRRQGIGAIARNFHLDTDELFQESYEVLLTCLRDFSPVYQKADGKIISVKFVTFFGNRMEGCAMEMRNTHPEYQARQAYMENMGDDEKAQFRADPPLLVQHLDLESPMQEFLTGEASLTKADDETDAALRVLRDSFFDRKLAELVAKETDEKKRTALLHVKVGGVYSFQEMAYHFGVTDSRASQVLNELVDAFYIQRMIDGNIQGVMKDFSKLKLNEKRVTRLVLEAMGNATPERFSAMLEAFSAKYPGLEKEAEKLQKRLQEKAARQTKKPAEGAHEAQAETGENMLDEAALAVPPSYDAVLTAEESARLPLLGVELRPISALSFLDIPFHAPESDAQVSAYLARQSWMDDSLHPALITEDGMVIDGMRRIQAAAAKGRRDYMCVVRKMPTDLVARKLLRVTLNLRLHKPSKSDLFYAIAALSDLGLSQQKIADAIGLSRTNVLVYAKVKDKASPKMRALFEDGLIQITNASVCTDLPAETQDAVAAFVRRFGTDWTKADKFNTLYEAAHAGRLEELESQNLKPEGASAHVEGMGEANSAEAMLAAQTPSAVAPMVAAMRKRLEDAEAALKDAEVWTSRRESVINSQAALLEEARAETETLKRELEASQLMRFGSRSVMEDELKELKKFYALTERVVGARYALDQASADFRKLSLRRGQLLELADSVDAAERSLQTLKTHLTTARRGQTASVTAPVLPARPTVDRRAAPRAAGASPRAAGMPLRLEPANARAQAAPAQKPASTTARRKTDGTGK